MSESRASSGAFRIGTVLGIPIRIHFTFLLLLIWYGAGSASAGEGFLDGVVFILLVFACVVLHELGHAAVGRRYGVETREIVLYPIGGVARLDRIPAGMAEFWIALAGPAVNLFLGVTLFLYLLFTGQVPTFDGARIVFEGAPLIGQFVTINFTLFAFNLFLPAFPMDGGRVLRAALSVFIGQTRATRIASRIGQGVAILMAIVAVLPPLNPFWLLIAFFVFVGAGQEAAFEKSRSAVAGLTARNAMITKYETIAPQESLGKAAELLLSTHQQDFPVVDAWGRVAGLLHRASLLQAIAVPGGRDRAVLEAMDREPLTVPADMPLETVLRFLQSRPLQAILVVGQEGGATGASALLGMITLDNLGELIQISQSTRPA
jgi:Zn-dependent protease/predicted transcriptional regulator